MEFLLSIKRSHARLDIRLFWQLPEIKSNFWHSKLSENLPLAKRVEMKRTGLEDFQNLSSFDVESIYPAIHGQGDFFSVLLIVLV